jgi:eukaryotic-like serine/threonine-protein kinase
MQIEVLGDRYELQDSIGRGGMATIYRGRDLRMDRVVAVKVLREVYSTDPKFVTRFQREAKAASALQHPNIVQVFDYGQTDGNYYIVMELVEGTDLRRYLRSRGVLDVDRAVIIAHDVALGLGAAHRRGIVHRDVKPQNVLVGRGGSIKLTDFGIASVYRDISAERLTTTGMTLGTVQYYAPEQAQGEIVSPAADVYALGIVMYEMLTGHTPFDGDSLVAVAMQHIQDQPTPPSQLNPTIPPALEEIILRCLEKVPEMRFRDGLQLARALESLGDHELGETVGLFTPGQTPVPITYNQIPPRPSTSVRSLARGGQEGNNLTTYAPDSGTPHLVQRGLILRSGVANQNQTGSRFFNSTTLLILLATLLLLGFSIYPAVQLGFISLPFFNGGSTPTPAATLLDVPDLKGKTWTKALQTANADGFQLRSDTGDTSGVVLSQNPSPPAKGRRGDTIVVLMQVKKVTVPSFPKNSSRATVEQILRIGYY